MSEATHDSHGHDGGHAPAHHAPAPPPTGLRRWTAPGWLRVIWMTPLIGFFGLGLVCLIRWAAHWDPVWMGQPIVTIALVSFPLGFLAGLGGVDYSVYLPPRRPTPP